ncbi:AAA family ATPase [Variovorax ginsengisoli]|uniref:AAA family ATPase n=1 Tax=Variovorax ginsengisoli TaxID=363844 RepID=A0ABT8S7H0_9BURK|nr:AAA family ATPase [Variovorax ginsengisoli]MDN8615686.1 AAA family ATPase [Variovorax ginsengisoli]MDO1534856.1 AAA family ATPase [Variovorax ginsengisoli]
MTQNIIRIPQLRNFSHDEIVEHFQTTVVVDHAESRRVQEKLENAANPQFHRKLICLVGPTGVGKSVAMRNLAKKRCAADTAPFRHRGIFLEAEEPIRGQFNFGPMALEALQQMNVPLAERTLPFVSRDAGGESLSTLAIEGFARKPGDDALVRRWHRETIERKTDVICIDEAVHCFDIGRAKTQADKTLRLKAQAAKLRTMSNKWPSAFILGGAFDFFDMTLVSAQLARRSLVILYEPYHADQKGIHEFTLAFCGLIENCPIEVNDDLLDNAIEVFLNSLGCVGIAAGFMNYGISAALRDAKPLSIAHLRPAYYPKSQLMVMQEEQQEGVQRVKAHLEAGELAVLSTKTI